MITDSKNQHYLPVKKVSALLKRTTSDYVGDFYCLSCFHSFRTKNVLKKHQDYCYVEMRNKDNNILKYNHGENFMKAPLIIYADMESLLKKYYLS